MRGIGSVIVLILSILPSWGATFGTTVPVLGGGADIVLDEARNRLYLVNSSQSRIEVFQTNFNPPRAGTAIRTDGQPVSAALSRDRRYLYVTCYDASALDIIDLSAATPTVTGRVTLPAKPEGLAIGGDGRALITTIGTGQGRSTLVYYDPSAPAGNNVIDVPVPPPAPAPPQLPPPNSRIFLAYRSKLETTRDGRFIVGVNGSGNTRYVFVYEVASGTVLRSRAITNLSGVLSIAPDGTKFMAGSTLFDFDTLAVLAQQNAANSPFVFPSGNANNFNLQQNQGGSVFSPDGSVLYSAFNIAPVQSPPARANVSRLLLNDPDNLLIKLGFQLPENLTGKMVITADGSRIYALSESGFVVMPVSTIYQSPIAVPDSPVELLANDQCGLTANQRTSQVAIRNVGGGPRMTATVQLLQLPGTGPTGLGGAGGPGGGGTGGQIVIVLPPVIPGGARSNAPTVPGVGGGANNASIAQTAPNIQLRQTPEGPAVTFQYSNNAARSLGTITPHDFLIQSPEAINIPPNVRVYQNNRNSEAAGTIVTVPVSTSASEGLTDLLVDEVRQRIYIANSGMNRIEVFDMASQSLLDPIKVGQLPHSMAFGVDNSTLYVANTGSEVISIIDLDKRQVVGRVKYPPIPFNAGFSLITPSVIASSLYGPQFVMSDGTLWKVDIGMNTAMPRTLNPTVFGTNARVIAGGNPAVRTMASSAEGRYIIMMTGAGYVYLYDAQQDEWIYGRQIFTPPITGYIGPVAAGPNGRYYLANGTILNSSLTPVGSAPTYTIGGTGTTTGGTGPIGLPVGPGTTTLPNRGNTQTVSRPVSAVSAAGNSSFLRFSTPVRLSNNATVTDAGVIEQVQVADISNPRTTATAYALEGPLSTVSGNSRVAINGRTMAMSGNNVYVLTTAGLSVIPISRQDNQDMPRVNQGGIVSTASYLPTVAPGGLISIFGRNLATSEASAPPPLPTIMGGTCITLDNVPLPLIMASAQQVNATLPQTVTAGRHSLVVRSLDNNMASAGSQVSVTKYAPAVFVDQNGSPAIYHADGRAVTKDARAKRDEQLSIYATGLGVTKGGKVTAGAGAPADTLAVTDRVQVFFGNPGYKEAEMIVNWSGLVPGTVGLYRIDITVPGAHIKGDALPVQIRIGGVNSPSTGPAIPRVAVE